MKKKSINLFIVTLFTLAIFSSCNKDKVTQEDVITNQQLIDFTIRVVDASNNNLPLDSAIVEIVDKGVIRTATSGEEGLAYFEGISISDEVPVVITKTNYTRVSTTYNVIPDDYRQRHFAKTVSLFPLSGENMATIQGRLTIESNVTNRVREAVPEGTIVRAFNYNLINDIAFVGTTNATGNYEIKVPVSYEGNDDITLVYPEIYTNQTVAVEGENYTIDVVNRPTHFRLSDNAKAGAIPSLPSVYATVEAPSATTIGAGFAVESKVIPTAVAAYSQFVLIDGGSGYTNGDNQIMKLSEGVNGKTASIQVDVSNGSIVNIDFFNNNDALYTSAPAVDTTELGGHGAVIDILFRCSYKIYITNNGSNYVTFPSVIWEYTTYSGTQLTEITSDFGLSTYTNLAGGKIVNKNFSNVDTIFTTPAFASAPVFTITDRLTEQIYISFDHGDISPLGQIAGYNKENGGFGYNRAAPPIVTLHTVAGYGSGAVLDIDLDFEGKLSEVDYVNRGTGYVKNVNDFKNDDITSDSQENPSFSSNTDYNAFRTLYDIKPGETIIRSAHYGTGTPVDKF